MKHLILKNIGPLCEADVDIDNLNIIIGAQSTGKSCVLKMACYCSWVEKRIMLTQAHEFYNDSQFIDDFVSYYKMQGYIKSDTFVSYDSPYISFYYEHKNKRFSYLKKAFYWQYKRPKLTYVPTERNVVSMFPNFEKLPNLGNHIQDFMSDWNNARTNLLYLENILGMGYTYHYDRSSNVDLVTTPDSTILELTNMSSGIQSMLPLFVHLDYLTKGIYNNPECNLDNLSLDKEEEVRQLLIFIYKRIGVPANVKKPYSSVVRLNNQNLKFWFSLENDHKKFEDYVQKLFYNNHTEIYLEEPENNLFPPTQTRLLDWLLDNTINSNRNDTLFIATHSPYILTKLLEKKDANVNFLFTYQRDGAAYVKTATKEEVSEILDYGVDMFFNYETFV